MNAKEWADRYLTALAEGSRTEAVHIDQDAHYDLDRAGRHEYARLIKEGK